MVFKLTFIFMYIFCYFFSFFLSFPLSPSITPPSIFPSLLIVKLYAATCINMSSTNSFVRPGHSIRIRMSLVVIVTGLTLIE